MKKINSLAQLKQYIEAYFWDNAYDVDRRWKIKECSYQYPVLVMYCGPTTDKHGTERHNYKILSRQDAEELLGFAYGNTSKQ